MAIFNSSDSSNQSSKTDTNTTIITSGSSIKGEMNLSCNLYVDGEFEGVITSKKEVNVGKNGHVRGDIITQRLVVQGVVEGKVSATRVEIKAAGKVNGTIESNELVIEAKGLFEGHSLIKNSELPSAKVQLDQTENPKIK